MDLILNSHFDQKKRNKVCKKRFHSNIKRVHGIVRNHYKSDAKLEMDFNVNVITLVVTLTNLAHALMQIEMDDFMYNLTDFTLM